MYSRIPSGSPAAVIISLIFVYALAGSQLAWYVPSQLSGQRPWIVQLLLGPMAGLVSQNCVCRIRPPGDSKQHVLATVVVLEQDRGRSAGQEKAEKRVDVGSVVVVVVEEMGSVVEEVVGEVDAEGLASAVLLLAKVLSVVDKVVEVDDVAVVEPVTAVVVEELNIVVVVVIGVTDVVVVPVTIPDVDAIVLVEETPDVLVTVVSVGHNLVNGLFMLKTMRMPPITQVISLTTVTAGIVDGL